MVACFKPKIALGVSCAANCKTNMQIVPVSRGGEPSQPLNGNLHRRLPKPYQVLLPWAKLMLKSQGE